MRNISLLTFAIVQFSASLVSADYFLKIMDTSVTIPATGTTTASVPVSLEITGPVPDNLLLDFYDMAFNISLPMGVTFTPAPPSDSVGATSLMTNFPVDSSDSVTFATLAVGANASSQPTTANITTASTPLFTIDFEVSSTTTAQFIPIGIPMNATHTFLKYPLFDFIDDPSTSMTDESMTLEMVALSTDSGGLTVVPEPSELILGFLMCNMLGVVISKRFLHKKNQK